jgi:hypothetical protein
LIGITPLVAINIANGENLRESPTLMFESSFSSEILCSYLILAKSKFKLKEILSLSLLATALTFILENQNQLI